MATTYPQSGITLRALLEIPFVMNPPQIQQTLNKVKDVDEEYDPFSGQSAFLGPNLWDHTLPYDSNNLKLEYMDLDEFLQENGIPFAQDHGGVHPNHQSQVQGPQDPNQTPLLNGQNQNQPQRLISPNQNQPQLGNLQSQNQPQLQNIPNQNQPQLPNIQNQNQPHLTNLQNQNPPHLGNLRNQAQPPDQHHLRAVQQQHLLQLIQQQRQLLGECSPPPPRDNISSRLPQLHQQLQQAPQQIQRRSPSSISPQPPQQIQRRSPSSISPQPPQQIQRRSPISISSPQEQLPQQQMPALLTLEEALPSCPSVTRLSCPSVTCPSVARPSCPSVARPSVLSLDDIKALKPTTHTQSMPVPVPVVPHGDGFVKQEDDGTSSCSSCSLPELISPSPSRKSPAFVKSSPPSSQSPCPSLPSSAATLSPEDEGSNSGDETDMDSMIGVDQEDDEDGEDFDPKRRAFCDDVLRPQPMIKKSKKVFVPEDMKDIKYWMRRRKNNLAAKRSRDTRRTKENQIIMRAVYLEHENDALHLKVEQIETENRDLRKKLAKLENVSS